MTILRSIWHGFKGVHADAQGTTGVRLLQPLISPPMPAIADFTMPGRDHLIERLRLLPGSRVVELGAGNGHMLDVWRARLASLASLELVDWRPALVNEARRRAQAYRNVRVVQADIGEYQPPVPADCVYLSYALSSAFDWVRVLNNAFTILKPGGTLGAADFYVAGAQPVVTRVQHGALSRWFWMQWFNYFQVHVSDAHLPALFALTDYADLHEERASLPGFPTLRVPYYVFTGIKPARARAELINVLWKKSAQQP